MPSVPPQHADVAGPITASPASRRMPMVQRVLWGVAAGAALGALGGDKRSLAGWTTADLGALANLYIQLLTALATPLIFFAILDAFVRTHITGRQGLRMMVICGINLVVAFTIGLTIMNLWQPGRYWQGTLSERVSALQQSSGSATSTTAQDVASRAKQTSLSLLDMLRSYVPRSVAQPFLENMVLTVAAAGILLGAAMRAVSRDDPDDAAALVVLERMVVATYLLIRQLLTWIIEVAPLAICLAVAKVVGELGVSVFQLVGVFLVTILAALGTHAGIYYVLSAWWWGKKPPRVFLGEGLSAILTGATINSSLATAPLTLDALRRMGVSESSARLSACVGTNFNNDGITLYEAITALFIAQAAGMELAVGQQLTILTAAVAGSMGIAGIPNSGLIILALVLKAARLPEETVQLALPVVYSIDFVLARVRSAVNVMGDLQVAVLLDRGSPAPEPAGLGPLGGQGAEGRL